MFFSGNRTVQVKLDPEPRSVGILFCFEGRMSESLVTSLSPSRCIETLGFGAQRDYLGVSRVAVASLLVAPQNEKE